MPDRLEKIGVWASANNDLHQPKGHPILAAWGVITN